MPPPLYTLTTLPVDCLLCIIFHLSIPAISQLSQTNKVLNETLHANATHIYTALIPQSISRLLLKAYKTSKSQVPFTPDDIDAESRCRRGLSSKGRDDVEQEDHGALFHFLLRRERIVVKDARDVMERLAGDVRARNALVANARLLGLVADEIDDDKVPHEVLLVESLRALLMLQWMVETLRLFGCAATKASRSSPGYSLIGCKYIKWFLPDFKTTELRIMHHAVLNLGGKSFTSPSKKWRSDAQGFEVNHFEMIFVRPFIKKHLADRGDWCQEV